MSQGFSHTLAATTLEATKISTAKTAAAALVTAMATAVALNTKAGFATAAQKAQLLARAYGELSSSRLP